MNQPAEKSPRSVPIDQLLPGMVLQDPVEDRTSGETLLEAGRELSRDEIKSLKRRDIYSVKIEPESFKKARKKRESGEISGLEFSQDELEELAEEVLQETAREQRERQQDLKDFYRRAVSFTGDLFERATLNKSLDLNEMRDMVSELQEMMLHEPTEAIKLARIRDEENYIHSHTVNVTILAIHLARAMSFGHNELIELGIGTLLHDIGMSKIPDSILTKTDPLEAREFKVIQHHPLFKQELLEDMEGLSYFARTVVLQHHERMDGSGYPHGLSGLQISKFARIAAVADSYEAMISPRVYHDRKTSYDAMQIIIRDAGNKFWKKAAQSFFQNMAIYPIGTVVELDSGAVGVVQEATNAPMRPKLKLLINPQGDRFDDPPVMNLVENRRYFINRVLEEIDL